MKDFLSWCLLWGNVAATVAWVVVIIEGRIRWGRWEVHAELNRYGEAWPELVLATVLALGGAWALVRLARRR